ncbi:MAG: hypothetical protein D6731_10595 [Planctomycetota bacterium]|nr:MAG: hypothetical protein D6731_10595 [Planctomycetota bacterium]
MRRHGRTTRHLAPFAAGAALAPLARALVGASAGEGIAYAGALAACALAVCLPARTARATSRALVLEFALAAAGFAAPCALFWPAATPALLVYLSALAAALAGSSLALGPRGQVGVSTVALAWLALPYWAAAPLSLLGERAAFALALHSPLPVLCGSIAGVDLLRTATLYQVFPLGQSAPYAYPSLLDACLPLLAIALLGWSAYGLRSWIRRRRGDGARLAAKPCAAVAFGLLLFGAPAPAAAQLFPEPGPSSDPLGIGDMVTRVNLGYYVPFLMAGELKLSKRGATNGSRLDFDRNLDLEPNYMVPTFEVALSWENGGLLLIQYIEAEWVGNLRTGENLVVEEKTFTAGNFIDTRYRFRSIALRGEVEVPVNEYLSFQILTTQRYLWTRSRIRSTPQGESEQSTGETLAPVFGVGAEFLVYDQIVLYGDIQWLDFRTSILGGEDHKYVQRYREWRAGVRLELVPHAHVLVEWYAVDTFYEIGEEKQFKQDLRGVRVQVSILF